MKLKRILLLLLTAILLSVALDLLLHYVSPAEAVLAPDDYTMYTNYYGAGISGGYREDYYIISDSKLCQIMYPLDAPYHIAGVSVTLAEPLMQDTGAVLFYGYDGLGAYDYVEQTLRTGTRAFFFHIPEGEYNLLRLDLYGPCVIEGVTYGPNPAVFDRTPVLNPLRLALFALLFAALFLLMSTRPVCRALKAVDRHVLDPESRPRWLTLLYAGFALVALLHHVVIMLYYPSVVRGGDWYPVLFWIFAGVGVLFGRLWQDKGFWCLLALFLVYVLRLFVASPVTVRDFSDFTALVYPFFGCYAVGRALPSKGRKWFLIIFCSLWVLAVGFLCVLGIWSEVTGRAFHNYTTGSIYTYVLVYTRLWMIYESAASGILTASGFAVSLVLCAMLRRPYKGFCVLFFPVILAATAFTSARTAFLLIGVALSLLCCLLIHDRLKPRRAGVLSHLSPSSWLLLLGVFGVLSVLFLVAQTYLLDLLNPLRSKGGLLISRALADTGTTIPHREVLGSTDLDVIFSGRISLWKEVLQYVFSRPENWFFGQSLEKPLALVYPSAEHCHNVLLQTLLESGVPGLLLMLGCHAFFLVCAFRLFRNKTLPFWQRLVPAPAIALLISELTECTTHFGYCFPQMTVLYLFVGFTVALGARQKSPD